MSGSGSAGSLEAIQRVVAAFERSDWTEIDVRAGDVRIHLRAGDHPSSASTGTELGAPGPVGASTAEPPDDGDQTSSAAGGLDVPEGADVIVSPTPGIFWRSPEPGAPPFADVGQAVDDSTTVCIIEVMKLMSHLKAGIRGEVVAVYGRNGEAVQKGEPLFAIMPVESGP